MSKQLLDSLLEDIQAGNSIEDKIAELSEEQLDALFGEAQPFKSLGTASSKKFVLGSVSNLREKYLKKLITTAMVSFLFQMKDEFSITEEDLANPLNKDDFLEVGPKTELPKDFKIDSIYSAELTEMYNSRFPDGKLTAFTDMENSLSEDDLVQVWTNANAKMNKLTNPEPVFNAAKYDEALLAAVEKQSVEERKVINRFLEWLFKFNGDVHTQAGGEVVDNDPERQDVEELKGTDAVYDNIPPNDTHCRFNAYYDINYEKLRDATKNIYNVKPDLEHAMIVYDVVDTQPEVDAFIHKYGSSSKYDILSFQLNTWTLMGPFQQNRERVDYYNKHNTIIKSMLEQQERDAALGEELMKKRVKSKKVRAEKVFGKDSPAFDQYRKMSPSELDNKYNAHVEEVDESKVKVVRETLVDAETGEELKVDDDGVPLNALEIPITTINAKTGETSQSRIFSRSDDK